MLNGYCMDTLPSIIKSVMSGECVRFLIICKVYKLDNLIGLAHFEPRDTTKKNMKKEDIMKQIEALQKQLKNITSPKPTSKKTATKKATTTTTTNKKETTTNKKEKTTVEKVVAKVKDMIDKKIFTTSIKGTQKNVKIRTVYNVMMYHFNNELKDYKKALLDLLQGKTFVSKTTKTIDLKKGVVLSDDDKKAIINWIPTNESKEVK